MPARTRTAILTACAGRTRRTSGIPVELEAPKMLVGTPTRYQNLVSHKLGP